MDFTKPTKLPGKVTMKQMRGPGLNLGMKKPRKAQPKVKDLPGAKTLPKPAFTKGSTRKSKTPTYL